MCCLFVLLFLNFGRLCGATANVPQRAPVKGDRATETTYSCIAVFYTTFPFGKDAHVVEDLRVASRIFASPRSRHSLSHRVSLLALFSVTHNTLSLTHSLTHSQHSLEIMELSPLLSQAQKAAASKFANTIKGGRYVVTGGTGFVGQRLVEMLVERGADRVISFDIVPP